MKDLIEKYLSAKAAEQLAIDTRVAIGNEIAARLGAPTEGSATHEVDGYKVTIKQPVNRRVDWEALKVAMGKFPEVTDLVRYKPDLDTVGLRWVQANAPTIYAEVSKAITATPGRVAVEVKEGK